MEAKTYNQTLSDLRARLFEVRHRLAGLINTLHDVEVNLADSSTNGEDPSEEVLKLALQVKGATHGVYFDAEDLAQAIEQIESMSDALNEKSWEQKRTDKAMRSAGFNRQN